MFILSVSLSGIVAIAVGFVGEAVVHWTGTKCGPFMLAIACLVTAFGCIWKFWVGAELSTTACKLTKAERESWQGGT